MSQDKPLPTSALAVANEFIALGVTEADGITHLVLQQLLLIAHGCSLAIQDTPLFIEEVQAWEHGPVVEEVFDKCKQHGLKPITQFIETKHKIREESQKELIKAVFDSFAQMESLELVARTHTQGTPWDTARNNHQNIVKNDIIKEYYKKIMAAPDAPPKETAPESYSVSHAS